MMETAGTKFKRILLDVLIAEPISVKGSGALTDLNVHVQEEKFLKDIYVNPFTSFNHISDEQPNENADPDLSRAMTIELNTLEQAKSSFESKLKGLRESLFVVKGGAESGKTTYIHHLQAELKQINFIFCDFEKASKAISLFGEPYDFEKNTEAMFGSLFQL